MWLYISYIVFSMCGVILMKIGGGQFSVNILDGALQAKIGLKIILAMLTYATSFLLWMVILNKNNLSFIMPLTAAITNILAVISGIIIFKEQLTSYQLIGIIIASIGIVVMNIK